jgi:sporulation protein YlmC with PRC-barrel domain
METPMNRMLGPLAMTLIALPLPLAAQSDLIEALTDPAAIGDAAQGAADRLASEAEDKVLVSEMIGREVTGPGGERVGAVDDLVVVPGGQIVAVLVSPAEGAPVALPYRALKVSAAASAAEQMGLSLPVSLEDARAMQGMQALTRAVTGE